MARTNARAAAAQERLYHPHTLLFEYGQSDGGKAAAFELAQDSIDALAGRYVASLEGVPAERVAAIGVIAMLMDIGKEVQDLRKDVQRLDETVGEMARVAEEEQWNQQS